MGDGELGSVKCLVCRHEDLTLDSWAPHITSQAWSYISLTPSSGMGGNKPVSEIHCPDSLTELINFKTSSSALALSQYIKLEWQDNSYLPLACTYILASTDSSHTTQLIDRKGCGGTIHVDWLNMFSELTKELLGVREQHVSEHVLNRSLFERRVSK